MELVNLLVLICIIDEFSYI